jgi:hypothetical protein
MLTPRATSSGNCGAGQSPLHGQPRQTWISLSESLPPAFPNEPSRTPGGSLRAFLRFVQMTGGLSAALASGVIAPPYRTDERPPRTLPWKDVLKVLHSISRSEAPGKRDFAIVLLLATYGLGGAEVFAIRLEDLDWHAGVPRVRGPKTNVTIGFLCCPQFQRY